MNPLYTLALLVSCTTNTESNYPSSAGPMGVGSSGSNEVGGEDSDTPIDTGDGNEGDTGTEDTGQI